MKLEVVFCFLSGGTPSVHHSPLPLIACARVNVCAIPPSLSMDAPVNSTDGTPSITSTCGRSRRPRLSLLPSSHESVPSYASPAKVQSSPFELKACPPLPLWNQWPRMWKFPRLSRKILR